MQARERTTGLTLVEVLVALAVFAVMTIIGVYIASSFTLTSKAQQGSQSQAFARSYLEIVRGLWSSEQFYRTNSLPTASDGKGLTPPDKYSYKVTIQTVDPKTDIGSYSYAATAPNLPADSLTGYVFMKRALIEVTAPDNSKAVYTTDVAYPQGN